MYSKWELALCRTCGSQGIHMACGQLKWANPVWECDECTSILSKYFIEERYYNYDICNFVYFFVKVMQIIINNLQDWTIVLQ